MCVCVCFFFVIVNHAVLPTKKRFHAPSETRTLEAS